MTNPFEDNERADGTSDIDLPTINVPPLPQVGEQMSDAEINRLHLQMSNLEINVIYQMWPQVKSIAGVTKLIDASIKAVKHQRDLLCLPYGYKGEATRKDIVFPPLDD
jgi:hypothetical protein